MGGGRVSEDEVEIPIKKEWTVSTRQIASILGLVTVLSGGGGALTAIGADELKNQQQDEKIAAMSERVEENRKAVTELQRTAARTETKVDGIDRDVSEIKQDVKDIVEKLNQAIGREQGRSGRGQ